MFQHKHKIDHSECDGGLVTVGFQIDPNRKLRPVRKEKKKSLHEISTEVGLVWFGLVWFVLIDRCIHLFGNRPKQTKQREKESPPHQTNLNKET